jgi:lipoate synthase
MSEPVVPPVPLAHDMLWFKYVASGPLVRSSYKAWEAALA